MSAGYIIGITGGIGSGKSTLSENFAAKGFEYINSDKIVSELYTTDKNILKKFMSIDNNIVNNQGEVNKDILRNKIFSDDGIRKEVESIVHPKVLEKIKEKLNSSNDKNFTIEVPLLFEANFTGIFTSVITVFCNRKTMICRMCKRFNIDKLLAEKMLDSHFSYEYKFINSDFIIYNNSSLEDFKKKCSELVSVFI